MPLQQRLDRQHFPNGCELVNGVEMHAENPNNFQIPHPVLKKHVGVGHFIELRREEIVLGMDAADLKTLVEWLGTQQEGRSS